MSSLFQSFGHQISTPVTISVILKYNKFHGRSICHCLRVYSLRNPFHHLHPVQIGWTIWHSLWEEPLIFVSWRQLTWWGSWYGWGTTTRGMTASVPAAMSHSALSDVPTLDETNRYLALYTARYVEVNTYYNGRSTRNACLLAIKKGIVIASMPQYILT